MELPAGTIVTARRPNKRVRWRSAVVQEPASQSTHTHVKLKFEGESHVHSLPWSHLQLPRTDRVSAVESRIRPIPLRAAAIATDVIDLETSPFSQADGTGVDEEREGKVREVSEVRKTENGGGMDFMRMTREWLMEKKEPQEKVEARRREEARKRLEAARKEKMRKKEEEMGRMEMERVGRIGVPELQKGGAGGRRRGGASSVFSFADYMEQARSGGGRVKRDTINGIHERGCIPQKRKQALTEGTPNAKEVANGVGNNLWRSERGEVDNGEIKRRRTSVELGGSLYSLQRAHGGPSPDVNERHPMQSSKDDFFYRIPRKGGYRPHASGATHVPPIRLSLQPRSETRAETAENRLQLTEMQGQELSVSSGGLSVRHRRVKRPPASRVAKHFEASNSPFEKGVVFDDTDLKVLDLCGDLSIAACVGEISRRLAETSLQNAVTMRGKGRKSQKPKRWCNPFVLKVQEVSAQQRNRHNVPKDIRDCHREAVTVTNASFTHLDDAQRRMSCTNAQEMPIILQCVCNRVHLLDNDPRNAVQCRVCGLWSHLTCTQRYQDQINSEDDFRQRFMCIQCLERSTIPIRVPVILSDDEAQSSGSDDTGADHTYTNSDKCSLIIQIRSLPQILTEFEESDKRRRRRKKPIPKATYNNSNYFRRSPLTTEDVVARAENIEELRSGVCKPSIEENQRDMMNTLVKNAQTLIWAKSHGMPHEIAEADETVSVARVALKRTLA